MGLFQLIARGGVKIGNCANLVKEATVVGVGFNLLYFFYNQFAFLIPGFPVSPSAHQDS